MAIRGNSGHSSGGSEDSPRNRVEGIPLTLFVMEERMILIATPHILLKPGETILIREDSMDCGQQNCVACFIIQLLLFVQE